MSSDYSNKMDDQKYLQKVELKLANKNVDDALKKLKTCNYYYVYFILFFRILNFLTNVIYNP